MKKLVNASIISSSNNNYASTDMHIAPISREHILARGLLDNFDFEAINMQGTCTACGKEDSHLIVKYTTIAIDKYICKPCAGKGLDAIFGVNSEVEEILYKESK